MRKCALLVCLLALLGLVMNAAVYAEGEAGNATISHGVVKSAVKDGAFVLTVKEGDSTADLTVKVNDKTVYADAEDKASTADAVVKEGSEVTVTHVDNLASKVRAMPKM